MTSDYDDMMRKVREEAWGIPSDAGAVHKNTALFHRLMEAAKGYASSSTIRAFLRQEMGTTEQCYCRECFRPAPEKR